MSSKQSVKHSITSGFRQADLDRALRAIRSAGYLVEQIEIVDRERRITLTTTPISDLAGYLSVPEACAYAGIGRTVAYELIAAGTLQTKKQGGRTLVSKTSIDEFLAKPREP
jgi:excisionase family DNA binding protein